jgi:hypothetical protein
MNDKFLTCTGKYGIDFNQIDRVERGYKRGVHFIPLFSNKQKYPIITLFCETERQATRLYNNIKAVLEEREHLTTAQIIKLADFRKE